MSPDQEKVARSLKRALVKVRDADLRLLVYDGSVHVCPSDVQPQDQGGHNAFEILETYGRDCTPIGLNADGGAGV